MEEETFVYETPSHEYMVSQQKDPDWQKVFGVDVTWYNISKFNGSGWDIVHAVLRPQTALLWLKDYNIISRDEYLAQVQLIGR